MLRKENLNKLHTYQEEQGPQEYWSTHEGRFKLPAKLPPYIKHRNSAPPPQGACWSGINPPILSTNNKVKGATTNMLRKEN